MSAKTKQMTRERRFDFRGLVRVNIDVNPWKILLTSKGINISNSGILTKFDQDSASKHVSLIDIHQLLSVGDQVGVQLEHKDIDLPITFLPATITRKNIINETSLEVGFEFQKTADELRSLIHEISQS